MLYLPNPSHGREGLFKNNIATPFSPLGRDKGEEAEKNKKINN
jgi:hypothetical protein